MTQSERTQLRRAIALLCTDDGFDAAMEILSKLAGMPQELRKALDKCKLVSINELASRPNTAFKYKPRGNQS